MAYLDRPHVRAFLVTVAIGLLVILVWPELLSQLFASAPYMPHGVCYNWQSDLLWFHIIADVSIGLAYLGISAELAILYRNERQRIALGWPVVAFGAFIFFCGLTHLFNVLVMFLPLYWFEGLLKAITAMASVGTLLALPAGLKSLSDLLDANDLSIRQTRELEDLYDQTLGRYRMIATYASDLIALVDQRGRFLYASPSHELALGYKPERLIGALRPDYVHPDDRESPAWRRRYALPPVSGVGLSPIRFRMRHAAGYWRWYESVATPVQIGDDLHFVTIARDIHDQVSAERALLEAYDQTLSGWVRALDLRDHETEGHSLRVTDLTLMLAEHYDFSSRELTAIRRGALLHDIGKIGVPDAVLRKPGPLNDQEWALMRQHPTHAYRLLTPISYLRDSIAIPHYHHEKFDGTGYPSGLKGQAIPLEARIFSIIDAYDALTSQRPYKPPLPHDTAIGRIIESSGTAFDPEIVDRFLTHVAPRLANGLYAPRLDNMIGF